MTIEEHAKHLADLKHREEAAAREEAERWLTGLIAAQEAEECRRDESSPARVTDSADDGFIGDGSGTYDSGKGSAESYMVGGGGPSAWLWFIFGEDGLFVNHAYMQYADSTTEVLVPIPAHEHQRLLDACRADATAQLRRRAR